MERNSLDVKYDAICYAALQNIAYKTKGAERIVLRNFYYNNEEHLFVIGLIMSCWSILGERTVAIDDGMFARYALTKKYKQITKVEKAKDNEDVYVDVDDMLEFMRPYAESLCGETFLYSDIYDAYYSGKE